MGEVNEVVKSIHGESFLFLPVGTAFAKQSRIKKKNSPIGREQGHLITSLTSLFKKSRMISAA